MSEPSNGITNVSEAEPALVVSTVEIAPATKPPSVIVHERATKAARWIEAAPEMYFELPPLNVTLLFGFRLRLASKALYAAWVNVTEANILVPLVMARRSSVGNTKLPIPVAPLKALVAFVTLLVSMSEKLAKAVHDCHVDVILVAFEKFINGNDVICVQLCHAELNVVPE